MLGEVFGCIIAGILACPLYGGHAKYLDPLIRAPHTPLTCLMSGCMCSLHFAWVDSACQPVAGAEPCCFADLDVAPAPVVHLAYVCV